jgi:uncharacterized protein
VTERPDTAAMTRIMLRPIGSPLPLTFLGLAIASFLLSARQLGFVEGEEAQKIGIALVVLPAPLHLVSTLLGFLSREAVGGLASALFFGTWLTAGMLIVVGEPETTSGVLGLVLVGVAVLAIVPAVAVGEGKLLPGLVIGLGALRLGVGGVYELSDVSAFQTLAGILGLITVAAAFYVALALALEDAKRRTVLPLGRRHEGDKAMHGDLAAQLEAVERDAGVRRAL